MIKKIMGMAVVAGLLFQSFPAHAYWRRGWGHGYPVRYLGPGYFSLAVAGLSYLYWEGMFYRYTPAGYVIVEPPVGAVVPALPAGYTTTVLQQTPYYYYNGTYYAAAPGGYTVVAPPPSVPVPAPSIPQTSAYVPAEPSSAPAQAGPAPNMDTKNAGDAFEIYIPNDNGSYNLITLKKVEKGFVGPQGEFYPEHPTVEKLKVLYGKTAAKT